jgi:hypothetical protein
MNNNKLLNLDGITINNAPSSDLDACNKQYVDNLSMNIVTIYAHKFKDDWTFANGSNLGWIMMYNTGRILRAAIAITPTNSNLTVDITSDREIIPNSGFSITSGYSSSTTTFAESLNLVLGNEINFRTRSSSSLATNNITDALLCLIIELYN